MTVSKYTPKYADIKVTLPYAKKRCTGAVVFNLQAFRGFSRQHGANYSVQLLNRANVYSRLIGEFSG